MIRALDAKGPGAYITSDDIHTLDRFYPDMKRQLEHCNKDRPVVDWLEEMRNSFVVERQRVGGDNWKVRLRTQDDVDVEDCSAQHDVEGRVASSGGESRARPKPRVSTLDGSAQSGVPASSRVGAPAASARRIPVHDGEDSSSDGSYISDSEDDNSPTSPTRQQFRTLVDDDDDNWQTIGQHGARENVLVVSSNRAAASASVSASANATAARGHALQTHELDVIEWFYRKLQGGRTIRTSALGLEGGYRELVKKHSLGGKAIGRELGKTELGLTSYFSFIW